VHADAGRPAADADRDGFATTGVSGVLAVDDHRFLAVERSFVTGVGDRVSGRRPS
jgi:hypothetical protein